MGKFYLDNPLTNDNRNYDYSDHPESEREEYQFISDLVEHKSKVIDLGCGNGSLLQKLIKEKNILGCGIEISKSGVDICLQKKLNVKLGRIDIPLEYSEDEFDYSICNVTIQMVHSPEILLNEMKRISKYQIITFPNFGFYKNRIDLLLNGRMPKPMLFGYKWYSTGHIHQLSIKDFYELIEDIGKLKLLRHDFVKANNLIKNYFMKKFPNLFQSLPIFLLEKVNT